MEMAVGQQYGSLGCAAPQQSSLVSLVTSIAAARRLSTCDPSSSDVEANLGWIRIGRRQPRPVLLADGHLMIEAKTLPLDRICSHQLALEEFRAGIDLVGRGSDSI